MSFGPVFAAGFAVQQLLEILTSILDLDSKDSFQKNKKAILGIVSMAVGFWLAWNGQLRVLKPLGVDAQWADLFVTALVLSAGTEGVNSILKFMKYSKEDMKNSAAAKVAGPDSARVKAAAAVVGGGGVTAPNLGVATAAAVDAMNRK